jgi:hypothetical protein
MSFADLLEASEWPLALDSYQRGFVWGQDKLMQLVSDLAAYAEQTDSALPYYLGVVLLHRNGSESKRLGAP